jgi:DNA/RNA endonuclease YhcR with UshA esterase domain
MKIFYSFVQKALLGFLFSPLFLFSQYVVDFEGAGETKTGYASGTVNLSGLDWNLTEVLIGIDPNDWKNGVRSARLRGYNASSMTMLENKANGIGTLSFSYRRYGTDQQVDWKVEVSDDNGGTWTQVGTSFTAPANNDIQLFSEAVNLPGNVRIRIVRGDDVDNPAANRRLNIDDIIITDFTGVIADTIVNLSSTVATVLEDATMVNVTLTLNQAVSVDKTVDFVLVSGDAALVDNFSSETVTFTAGGSLTQTVSIDVTALGNVTGSEVLEFELQNPSTGLLLGTNDNLTLTINEIVPLPTYTIATLRGLNANGGPDSLGVDCHVEATVIGVNFGTGLQLNFFIHDGTAGMGVFVPANANTFGYSVQEGDSLRITGRVAVFRGQAQLDFVSAITVLGQGTVPAPVAVTALGESTEGEIIVLEDVEIVNQANWGNNVGGGYDVRVTNGVDTFLVRVDADTEIFGTPIPGCKFNVTGIGTQFSTSSTAPFTDGYRMLPRFLSDFDVLEACVVPTIPTYTIATIRGNNTNGLPDSLNVECRVRGTVYGINLRVDGGMEFTIHDNTAGIGVYVPSSANTFSYTVAEGDSIELVGEVRHFNGLAQMGFLSELTLLGQGTLREPRVVTILDESTESDLVKLANVTMTATSTWPSATANANITLNSPSGTFTARILSVTNIVNEIPAPSSAFNLIGIGSQFDNSSPYTSGYQLVPRRAQDFEAITDPNSVNTLELSNFTAYPVPADNVVNVSFTHSKNEAALVTIYDVTGKHVRNMGAMLQAGGNQLEVSLNNLEAGYYFISIQTLEGMYNTKVLKK